MIKIVSKIINYRFGIQSLPIMRLLEPVVLSTKSTNDIPKLKLKSQKYLMQNWWSEKPFQIQNGMLVPIFNFQTAEFSNKSIQLPEDIFNQPLRRDLMHRLYDFRINLNKFTSKVTRDRAMTAGSGKKMRAQKKTGMARQGDKRAPHLRKGGKAHGSKAKVYSYHLNAKIKLNALKALFSAKMAEGKIKIIDSEIINEPKTKVLASFLKNYCSDQRALYCIITSQQIDDNFSLAKRNIKKLIHHNTYDLDVISLFKADKIFITVKGLQELIQNIYKTSYVAYRQPYMPKVPSESQQEEEIQQFNPEKPYEFKFKILAEYLDTYKKLKQQKPEYIERQLKKIRKIELV